MTNVVIRNLFLELCDEGGALRAWAHHAHFTFEHTDQLRQFVDVGLANEGANPRHARVVLACPNGHTVFSASVRMLAEFQAHEAAPTQTHTFLTVMMGPALSSLMARAVSSMTGEASSSRMDELMTSNRRLTTMRVRC